MRRLSEAQWRFLRKIDAGDGFLRCREADMRTHSALLKLGFVALAYNDGKGGYENGYVFTPAGRAALAQSDDASRKREG